VPANELGAFVPMAVATRWLAWLRAGQPEKVAEDLTQLMADARALRVPAPAPGSDPPTSAGPAISTR
jgi:hypothetical protein